MSVSPEINLELYEKQALALESPATELLYGGAAGGGKSHLMRVAAVLWAASIPGLQVYLFRRIRDDLVKNHMEGPKGLRALLAPWVLGGFVRIVEDEIRFWNGSRLYLCHCKDEKDVYKYQGAEIHVLLLDELTHFSESMYRFLRNRVRMVGLLVPTSMRAMFPRILAGGNPGNIGHLWVKRTFVERGVETPTRMPDEEGGMLRQFVPARLEDNPSMQSDDPGYEKRLEGLGSKQLVAAMRWGDWDVIDGAFFDCWDPQRHVLQPFTVPDHWLRFRSADWGSAKPFSVGWWAVASEPMRVSNREGRPVILPRGAMVRYREWYGSKGPNVGLKLHAEQVAGGIRDREKQGEVSYGVIDPSTDAQNGGLSIMQRMAAAPYRVLWRPADNTRVPQRGAMGGWDQMRARMVGDDDGHPMIACFASCHDSIRTIPALQHDKSRAEDVDTDNEDHAADDWRYACNSRPWVKPTLKAAGPRDVWRTSQQEEAAGWKTV